MGGKVGREMKYNVFALFSGTHFSGEIEAASDESAQEIADGMVHELPGDDACELTEVRVERARKP